MCELVMANEDFPKQLVDKMNFEYYSPTEDSEDDDTDLPGSYDIQLEMDFGVHRLRSNTAQRLEKLDLAQKKAAKVKHIKWETNSTTLSSEQLQQIFVKREYKKENVVTQSLLTEQLQKYTNLPQNPYLEYAKYDGNAQVGIPIRKYKIFLTMLPEEQRNYPMNVCVIATAKVADLIGLILLKCSTIHGDFPLQPVSNYGLYFTEDDGEVDRDFPCLDARECVVKFGFTCLGLVEHKSNSKNVSFETTEVIFKKAQPKENDISCNEVRNSKQDNENMARMKVHTTAMEAPLYQCYKVSIIHKVRTKTEIHLGISGDKIEIDPIQQKNSKFWVKQKAVSYHMDSIAWCELVDSKSGRGTFRVVYSLSHNTLNQTMDVVNLAGPSHSPMLQTSASFKHYDFETDLITAEEIVQKINLILELRSSTSRKEYLAAREKKTNRRRSFHLGSKS